MTQGRTARSEWLMCRQQ